MFRLCTFFVLILLLSIANAAEKSAVDFLNGSIDTDKRTLIFHFKDGDKSIDKRVTLPEEVVDVKRCAFLRSCVAFFVQTSKNGVSSFYYGSLHDSLPEKDINVIKIAAPEGKWKLVGIVNTEGDSLVATAIEHDRKHLGGDVVKGWMMINNCTHPSMPVQYAYHAVVKFDVPAGFKDDINVKKREQ